MQMVSYKMCMVDMATESVRTWKSLRRKGALPSNEGLLGIILLKKIIRWLVISNGEKHQMFWIWFYRNGNKDDDWATNQKPLNIKIKILFYNNNKKKLQILR